MSDIPARDGHRLDRLARTARQVADELGLRCVDEIEDLTVTIYATFLNGPPRAQPWTEWVARELRRQLVIWAWEEGQEGGSLPLACQSPSSSKQADLEEIHE